MRVLLVEDDPSTAKSIELMLSHANLNVYSTDLGEEGIDLAKLFDYDLILLDINLPDMNGHEVLRQLRLSRIETPILILSGEDGTESKLKGFGFGADDYMTKPFHREELVARIHAIIRRSKGHAQSIIKTGVIAVNLDAKTVEVDSSPVHLTGKEYQMLELLSLRKGTTLTKEMFLNHLYGGMDEPELKIIDVFICKLRKKLTEATGGAITSKPSGAAATYCAIPNRGPSTRRKTGDRRLERLSRDPEIWRHPRRGTAFTFHKRD
ncbi:cell cycle transcriptional regulator [Octadecabacter arcticus 238]|uniref:Cell cycle transcriptional regulator n=1 Tax=Octadecabacter arcticus 238 TaxID=391616 RepID=M9RKA9_9RHOB|nr:cell cycle transcriptional regulator [Octadecabacter arcticus 238]